MVFGSFLMWWAGGGAFVLVFIAAFLVFGLSVFIIEMILGRASRQDSFSTFESLAPKEKNTINMAV